MWSKLITIIIQAIVFPLVDKLWDKFNDYLEREKSKKKDSEAAEAARQKMEEAKTAKEVDEKADDTLSGI